MPGTAFRPEVHGFGFPNRFTNQIATLPSGDRIRTNGRCGGMAYAALDIFHAGRTAPDDDWSAAPRGVPPDDTPIAAYISKRLLDSYAQLSAVRFIAWTLLPSTRTLLFRGVDGWTAAEVHKLCASIDSGTPGVLGLVGAQRLPDVGRRNHQVVVFGYRRTTAGVQFDVYDNNAPRRTVTLDWTKGQSGIVASNRRTPWRGMFLHTYEPHPPPTALWRPARRVGAGGAGRGRMGP